MTDATADAAPASATPFKASTYSYYVLFLLFLGYVMNFADRQVVSILAQDIKTDLGLSDTEMGLLTGPAIALFYAVLGIPMAYLADRTHRVRLLALCLVLWSALTALGGAARNLAQLAATRIGVSIAEAGGTPVSASLIGDYFPPEKRATALGLYSSAAAVGVLFGFALGGIVNDAVGWRWAMIAAGAPGIVLALLMLLTLREPKRGAADPGGVKAAKPATGSMWQTLKQLWSIREYRRVVLAASGANMSVYVLLSWAPSVALRTFDVTSGQVGIFMGLGVALLGAASLSGTGFVADAMNKKSRVPPLRLIALLQYLVVPLMVATLFAPTFALYMAAVSLAYAAIVSNSPVAWALTQNYTPPELRASAAASMALVYNLVGLGLGPPLAGLISDMLTSTYGDASLRYAMMLVAASSLVAGLLLSFWVVPAVKEREAAGR